MITVGFLYLGELGFGGSHISRYIFWAGRAKGILARVSVVVFVSLTVPECSLTRKLEVNVS